jgi:hypothetical protein
MWWLSKKKIARTAFPGTTDTHGEEDDSGMTYSAMLETMYPHMNRPVTVVLALISSRSSMTGGKEGKSICSRSFDVHTLSRMVK